MPRQRSPSSRSRLTRVLAGIGISVTSFLLVVGIFLAAVTVVKLIRLALEARFDAIVRSAQERVAEVPNVGKSDFLREVRLPTIENPTPSPRSELTFASFGDHFSSGAALDSKGTTMYRDDAATAFMFPPNVEWAESGKSDFLQEVGLPHIESACVRNSCLAVKGTVLTLNGAVLTLPGAEGEITSLSTEVLGSRWIVGVVRTTPSAAKEEKYAGYIYWLNGASFIPVFPNDGKALNSEYPGAWGFGGAADDFLAVYGAYRGKGYRIRQKSSSLPPVITDISWLFDVRMMRGGIMPGIVRIASQSSVIGHTSSVDATWYLFNKARNNRPVFLKLFQNGTDDIVGEANLLGTAPQPFSYLALMRGYSPFPKGSTAEPGGISDTFPYSLAGYAEQSGTASSWTIKDLGFKIPPAQVTVSSVNLNNYKGAEIRHVVKFDFREFSAGGASIALAAKNTKDGEWEPIERGEKGHWFKNPRGMELYWKMTVIPGTNPDYAPFIGILDLDYEVKRY